jgi:hypothetical protein
MVPRYRRHGSVLSVQRGHPVPSDRTSDTVDTVVFSPNTGSAMESIIATTPFPPEDPIGVIIHNKGGSTFECVYEGELANFLSSLIQSRGSSLTFTPPRCRSQLFSALNVAYDSMQRHGRLRR